MTNLPNCDTSVLCVSNIFLIPGIISSNVFIQPACLQNLPNGVEKRHKNPLA
jgi:hypothetical protein